MSEEDSFSSLPVELSVHILKYLHCTDVAQLARSSTHFALVCKDKYLWRLLLERRFGVASVPEDGDKCREEFEILSRNALCKPANLLGIIWGDNSTYWHISNGRRPVARLHNVWWFDVTATFKGVLKGFYTPIVKVRLQSSREMSGIAFWAQVQGEDGEMHPTPKIETALPQDVCTYGKTTRWFQLPLPTLDVGTWRDAGDYHTVTVFMIDHDCSRLKSGLLIEYVKLVKAGEIVQSDEEDGEEQYEGEAGERSDEGDDLDGSWTTDSDDDEVDDDEDDSDLEGPNKAIVNE
ncbi:hypothetical protein HK104_011092 [Borealophlyctis nickersoniae]|nr:hypothetical protein HK104_011092 [Borealophlyctis nickersoniae]